jgi:hypothetical protein
METLAPVTVPSPKLGHNVKCIAEMEVTIWAPIHAETVRLEALVEQMRKAYTWDLVS